jgi:hypothetical protein
MFFMYETMINGGWVELSKTTFNYFSHTNSRRRFRPFVWLQRLYKNKRKEIRS